MKEMFLDFVKKFGIMLLYVAMVITIIGAISTKDIAFVLCGVVSTVILAVIAVRFIKSNSGDINRTNEE